jgi:hypothetical protein
MDKAENLLS